MSDSSLLVNSLGSLRKNDNSDKRLILLFFFFFFLSLWFIHYKKEDFLASFCFYVFGPFSYYTPIKIILKNFNLFGNFSVFKQFLLLWWYYFLQFFTFMIILWLLVIILWLLISILRLLMIIDYYYYY